MSIPNSPIRNENRIVSFSEWQILRQHSSDAVSKLMQERGQPESEDWTVDWTDKTWAEYKKIEQNALGDYGVVETFKKQMGLELEGTKTKTGHIQFDLERYRTLFSYWTSLSGDKAQKDFLKLKRYEQKLLIKAFEHFSQTNDPMREGSPKGLNAHELIILHSLVKSPYYPLKWKEIESDSFKLFQSFYGLYKKGVVEEPNINVKTTITDWRKALPLDLSHPFEDSIKSISPLKKRELYQKGEKIAGELKNEFIRLRNSYNDLRIRSLHQDPHDITLDADNRRYQAACRVAIAKGEALVDLYLPYLNDKDMTFLCAKAVADLSQLYVLGDRNNLENLSLMDAVNLADRADQMGHPTAAILLSKLLHLQEGILSEKSYERAKAKLEKFPSSHLEAQLESARLATAAWRAGIKEHGKDLESKALDILRPLGRLGADGLRELFEAGSTAAANDLILLMSKDRFKPLSIAERIQRFIQQIVNLFSFGPATLFGEEAFLSKDPKRLSQAEIDFLIKAALWEKMEVNGAKEFVENAIKAGLEPKIPLQQADAFLRNLTRRQNPYMVVNKREAYRYFQFATEIALNSPLVIEWKEEFVLTSLDPYLKHVDKDTFAYELLTNLRDGIIPP